MSFSLNFEHSSCVQRRIFQVCEGIQLAPGVLAKGAKGWMPSSVMSMKLPLTWVMRMRTGIQACARDNHSSTWVSYLPLGRHTHLVVVTGLPSICKASSDCSVKVHGTASLMVAVWMLTLLPVL